MPDDRIHYPLSDAEMNRRWIALRAEMAAAKIDVLVAQGNNDFMGGYVRYLTDVPATNGYAVTVVFPREDKMTVIGQGPFGQDRRIDADPLRRGVGRLMGVPSYVSANYSVAYDAELACRALEPLLPHGRGTIGLVGMASMPFALVDTLRKTHPGATIVDAADLVDRIKAVKSAEERALIREVAAMQDRAMRAAFAAIRPGMRDIEVAAIAEQVGHSFGSEQGLFLCASGPVGRAAFFGNRHVQNRVIQEGDSFTLLIENNGAGGLFTEIGRTCVLGKVPQEMVDELGIVLEARANTLSLMKPGATCKDIWDAHNAFMRSKKRPEEKRVYCHGQGHDMVERPLVRFDEPMPLPANLNFACHPAYQTERVYSWICDNFFMHADGRIERLHRFPEEIVELG